jgi:DNA-binding response OmpR family regulator
MPAAHLLVVEDDAELRSLLTDRLRDEGYRVSTAASGPDALDAAQADTPDVVLLDVMLPGFDGLEVCRRLRALLPTVYVMMLTAKASEVDRIVGLEVGADDYVTKPFSLQEVVARVRAALRRLDMAHHAPSGDQPIAIGELHLDPERREVAVGGEPVQLTVREFDLLHWLAAHPDKPFTRMQLLDKVWDLRYEGYERTVDSHVQRLRAKIEPDPGQPRYVKTVWGVGYKLQSEPS